MTKRTKPFKFQPLAEDWNTRDSCASGCHGVGGRLRHVVDGRIPSGGLCWFVLELPLPGMNLLQMRRRKGKRGAEHPHTHHRNGMSSTKTGNRPKSRGEPTSDSYASPAPPKPKHKLCDSGPRVSQVSQGRTSVPRLPNQSREPK